MILKLQWVNALCVAVVPALSECAEIDPSIFRGGGGEFLLSHVCLERRGTRNPFTVPSSVKLLCFTAISPTQLQWESVYSICAAALEFLPRSARISARGSTFSRGGVRQRSEKLPGVNLTGRRKKRFTSIRGISVSNGTHNSEEQNTNTTLYLRLLLLFLLFLLSSQCWSWRMAQILPIRFQEHLQVKPHKHTQHSCVSARRVAIRQTVNTQLCISGLARALRSCTHKLHTWYICDI